MKTLTSMAIWIAPVVWLIATPSLAETTLVYNVTVSKFHPFFRGAQAPWKKAVERATNGEVKVKFPAASLASQRRQWGMVTGGVADVAISNSAFQRKRLLLPPVSHLPFATSSAADASVALWRTHLKYFVTADEFKGVKLLGMFVHAGSQIFSRERAITGVADFKGMKLRTSAGLATALFKKLGAVPVPSSGPQIFEFASKGVVDGLIVGFAAVRAFKIAKYLKHMTAVPGAIGNVSWGIIMNQDKWNGLTRAHQEAVMGVSGENISRSGGTAWDGATAKGLAQWKKQGKAVAPASPAFVADLRKRFAFAEQAWFEDAAKRGVDGRAALAYYKAQAGVAGK